MKISVYISENPYDLKLGGGRVVLFAKFNLKSVYYKKKKALLF